MKRSHAPSVLGKRGLGTVASQLVSVPKRQTGPEGPEGPAPESVSDSAGIEIPVPTGIQSDKSSFGTAEKENISNNSAHFPHARQATTLAPPMVPKPKAPVVRSSGVAVRNGKFRSPLMVKPQAPLNGFTPNKAEPPAPSRYFNVMWTKATKKKHKTFDDGLLAVLPNQRRVELLDLEGKVIGKITLTKTDHIKEGAELSLGGKDIEVLTEVPAENYMSGKVFMKTSASSFSNTPKLAMSAGVKALLGKGTAKPLRSAPTNAVPSAEPEEKKVEIPEDAFVLNSSANGEYPVIVESHLLNVLRPHQREGVSFMYRCLTNVDPDCQGQGCILADEMGLGKTLQTICLAYTLLKSGPVGRPMVGKVLVACPSSLVKNWYKEFKKWVGVHRLQFVTIGGGKEHIPDKQTLHDFLTIPRYRVLIISYTMFRRFASDLTASSDIGLVVADEGHTLKNCSSGISKALSMMKTRRRVLLTGTPIQNDLEELWNLINFCNPEVLGPLPTFKRVYEHAITHGRDKMASLEAKELGETRAKELSNLTSRFILRREASAILSGYLPPKREYIVFCRPTETQKNMYRSALRSKVISSCLSAKDQSQALCAINILRKVVNHPSLLSDTADVATSEALQTRQLVQQLQPLLPKGDCSSPELSGKMSFLVRLLSNIKSSTSDKVVLVSNYTQTLDIFEGLCISNRFEFCRLDGSTPTEKRQPLVDSFNSGYSKKFIFLLSAGAGGVGLNLVGANRLILFDCHWNPALDLQVCARVWRDGQKSDKVYIYRLLTTGTLEEKIYQRQLQKISLASGVTDHSDVKRHFSRDDLRTLFILKEDVDSETYELQKTGREDVTLPLDPVFIRNVDPESLTEKLQDASLQSCLSVPESPVSFIYVGETTKAEDLPSAVVTHEINVPESEDTQDVDILDDDDFLPCKF